MEAHIKTLRNTTDNSMIAPRTYASAVKYDGTEDSIKTVIDNKHKTGTGSLTVVGWNDTTKSQTISVTGVTASNTVIVSAAPTSATKYANAGIICTAQGTGTLTFTYTTKPTEAIPINVVILN